MLLLVVVFSATSLLANIVTPVSLFVIAVAAPAAQSASATTTTAAAAAAAAAATQQQPSKSHIATSNSSTPMNNTCTTNYDALLVLNAAAKAVGVRPATFAPRLLKRIVWKIEKTYVRIISWLDCPDSKLSLRVLWWKAIFGNSSERYSPVHDDGLAYDMLPNVVRVPVCPLVCRWFLYPARWMTHVVVEIRTAYLDRAIRRIAANVAAEAENADLSKNAATTKVRLITMGGGYDIRSIKLLNEDSAVIDEAIELDLPDVVEAKRKMFQRLQERRKRLLPNRTSNNSSNSLMMKMPTLYATDFRRLDDVSILLRKIMARGDDDSASSSSSSWHNIFLFEGVLMYLEDDDDGELSMKLLRVCRNAAIAAAECDGVHYSDKRCIATTASLCFADRIIPKKEGINSNNFDNDIERSVAESLLAGKAGWTLVDWLVKGGGTRHMGVAKIRL